MPSFKLAVFSDEVSQDLSKAIQVAGEYNLQGLEIRSVWDKPPQELDKEDTGEIKKQISTAGLSVCSIGSPFFKCDIDSAEEYKQHLGILERCIHLAERLGTTIIRGFTFWRKGDWEARWQSILDHFPEPVRMLERAGMTLAIENEHSTFIGTGKLLARFLADLDSPRVAAVWDAANSIHDTQQIEEAFPEGYEAIRDRMVHCHAKDAAKDENGKVRSVCIGDGLIDWPGQFRALDRDGYRGYVSLETHWRPTALSEEEVNRPGGSNFSKEGEYASRICLDRIKAMLADL